MQSEGERSDELSDDMHVGWGCQEQQGGPQSSRVFFEKKQEARPGVMRLRCTAVRPQPLSAAARQPPKLNLAGTDNAAAAKAGAEAAAE